MAERFNPRLRRWMDGNNPDGGVVLNRHFARWKELLEICLSTSDEYTVLSQYMKRFRKGASAPDIDLFQAYEFKDLLDECKAHSDIYRRKAGREELLVFVHPMYAHILNYHHVQSRGFVKEGRAYYRTFKNVLNFARGADIGVLLMETPQHYAAVTSLLMEQGFATDVVFTHFDSGAPLDEKDADVLLGSVPYFGGGYRGLCLGRGIMQALYTLGEGKEIYAIRDLVVQAPYEKETKTLICQDNIASDHLCTISLDEFMEEMRREKQESRAVQYNRVAEPILA